MPPISHILRFWTSSATLNIETDKEPESPKPYYFGHGAAIEGCATILNPAKGETIGYINLTPGWLKGHSGPAEFIVISSAVEYRGETPAMGGDIGLNILLIEWKHGVAYRVQKCLGRIGQRAWREARPTWKLISLG